MKQLVATNEKYNNFSADQSMSFPHLAMLMDDGSIYRYSSGAWARTNAEPANAVAVALGGAGFFCLDKAGNVYQWNEKPDQSQWTKDTGISGVTSLSCDPEWNLWAVTQNGEIHIRKANFVGLGSVTGKLFELEAWKKAGIAGPMAAQTPPPASAPSDSAVWTYKVQKDDTLTQIVKDKYGVQGKKVIDGIIAEIVRLNKIKDANKITTGDKLSMPPLRFR